MTQKRKAARYLTNALQMLILFGFIQVLWGIGMVGTQNVIISSNLQERVPDEASRKAVARYIEKRRPFDDGPPIFAGIVLMGLSALALHYAARLAEAADAHGGD